MDFRVLKRIDFHLLLVVGMIITLGLLEVLSATYFKIDNKPYYFFIKQLLAVIAGIVISFFFLFFDYHLPKRMAQFLYWANILVLIAGIPLPFVSFGGTSMVVNLVSVALLNNIWVKHTKILF